MLNYIKGLPSCKNDECNVARIDLLDNPLGNYGSQKILEGKNYGLPDIYNAPVHKKPEWLDIKKLKVGQEFAKKYFVGVNMSEMLSLYILFAIPNIRETLIYTKKSSTPFTAFQRYLSTLLRVASWYDHDLWDKESLGYANIQTVRGMHLNASKRINAVSDEDLKPRVSIVGSLKDHPVLSSKKKLVQEDFQPFNTECPFQTVQPTAKLEPKRILVNQLDMSITQFGFMGLMITHPDKFGAADATKEELEGFVHLWRVICYLLGVEDEFNFCAGSFEEVYNRSEFVIDKWVRPNFCNITEDWEHLSRCMAEGMAYVAYPVDISFEVTLLYMCWVLDVPAPQLFETLTYDQVFSFYSIRFIMTSLSRMPGVIPMLNWVAKIALARASSLSLEELKKLENKDYSQKTKPPPSQSDEEPRDTNLSKSAMLSLIIVARLFI